MIGISSESSPQPYSYSSVFPYVSSHLKPFHQFTMCILNSGLNQSIGYIKYSFESQHLMCRSVWLYFYFYFYFYSFLLGFPNLTGCVCVYARLSLCNVSPNTPSPSSSSPHLLFLTQVATVKTVRRTRDIIKARREAAAAALIIPMFEEGYPRIVDLDDTSFLLEVGGHNRETQYTPLHA